MVRWERVSGPDLANRPPQGSNLGGNRLFWAIKLIGSLMTAHQWCTSSLRWRYLSIKGNSRFWLGEGVVAWCGERKEPAVTVLIAFWCPESGRTVYSARFQMAGGSRLKYQAASSPTPR